MNATLYVNFNSSNIGYLSQNPMCFRYSETWLKNGFPISLNLPFQKEPFDPETTEAFFGNLLPEGDIYEVICRSKKISSKFQFFETFGYECAGALSLFSSKNTGTCSSLKSPVGKKSGKIEITGKIRDYLKKKSRGNLYLFTGSRMSLGGAQDKLPVLLKNNKIFLPSGDFPTTHIIKIESQSYPGLARNEHFCMELAKICGLSVADSSLLCFPEGDVFITLRFDRKNGNRIHQEDFCQALGLNRVFKYQAAGGYDGISSLVGLCRQHGIQAGDFFAKMLIFNYLIGNHDGHAKNISLLYDSKIGKPDLAPLYDLVSTEAYDFLERNFGMAFGDTYDKYAMTEQSLVQAAEDCGISQESFFSLVSDMTEKISATASSLTQKHQEKFGKHEIYEKLNNVISQSCKTLNILCTTSKPTP